MNVTGGIDTSATATNQHALALDAAGTLEVVVATGGELAGSNYGMAVRAPGDFTLTNDGLITSVNHDAVYAAITGGNVATTNNGVMAGGIEGIHVVTHGDGTITVTTGAGSKTTAGPAQTLETASSDPWGQPDMLAPSPNDVFDTAGINVEKLSGAGDISITTGADSLVDGVHGILVANHGTGSSSVTVGQGATVNGMGPDPDFSSAALGGGGISVTHDAKAGEITISTGAGSTINGVAASADIAPFGITAQSLAAAPITITTGADSHVAASAFAILAQANSGDTHIATGAQSTVDGTISGIVSVGTTDLDVTTGESSLVRGQWTGIMSVGAGDVTVTTGAGSTVTGSGGFDPVNAMPPGFASLPKMPTIPAGVPLELTTIPAAGIKIMATGKTVPPDPDAPAGETTYLPLHVTVNTGADSLVQGQGTLANGIDITTASANAAIIRVSTGERSEVIGGDGFISSGLGMGTGISVIGGSLTGTDIAIDTGTDSLVDGGAAGIMAMTMAAFTPNSLRITTGTGSTVIGSGTPLTIDSGNGDESSYSSHIVTPVVGISASLFGSTDSDMHIITGEGSTVTAPTFDIQAISGVLNTSITVETGANSLVSATGSGTVATATVEGVEQNTRDFFEIAGGYTPASGIFVSSVQFNEMNVVKPNAEGDKEFYSRASQAGDVNVTTGLNSTVTGTANGITVGTMMTSQRELFWPTGQDQVDPATYLWAPARIAPNGMMYGADGDNDPNNDPVLESTSLLLASDQIGGTVNIAVNGTVTGQQEHGIYAPNIANAVALNVSVRTTGIVEGAQAAIYAVTDRSSLIDGSTGMAILAFDQETGEPRYATDDDFASSTAHIVNQGVIRNLSQKSTDLAILTDNTATTIDNTGLLLGTVDLDSKPGNHVNNQAGGIWNTAGGTNYLGALGEDGLPLASNTIATLPGSTIVGAAVGETAETTTFHGVSTFSHGGLLTLLDGGANDRTVLTGAGATFVSNGGTLALDTVLASDGAPSDLLVIEGATQLGSAPVTLVVKNAGGAGAATVADGIKVVQVDGASAAGAFALKGDYQVNGQQAVVAGAYGYTLWHNGVGANADDGDWYLRSRRSPTGTDTPGGSGSGGGTDTPLYQPAAPVAEVYPQALLAMMDMPTLQQRVGNRFWSAPSHVTPAKDTNGRTDGQGDGTPPQVNRDAIWARVEGMHARIDPAHSTTGARHSMDRLQLQAGADITLDDGDNGTLIGGINGHYAKGDTDVRSVFGDGRIETDAYGLGATLTWYGHDGFYIDGQARISWFSSDLESDILGTLAHNNDGHGYAVSLETGKRMAAGSGLTLTPQAQLVYTAVDFDGFNQVLGSTLVAHVEQRSARSLQGRLGLSLDRERFDSEGGRSHLYAIANLQYRFSGTSRVDMGTAPLTNRADRLWGTLGLGGSHNWNQDRVSLYGEIGASSSLADFGDSYMLKGTVGLRYRW